MTRTRMSATARRHQLLDVARDVVAAEGFHAATIERVAREAGVTRTLIYRQFGDLPGMVAALVERETEVVLDGLLHALTPVPADLGPTDVAVATVRATLEATAAAPVSWRILLNPPEGGPPELHERISAGRALARAHVRHLLTDRIAVRLPDPDLSAHLVHLVGDELVRLHVNDPETYPVERILAQVRAMSMHP